MRGRGVFIKLEAHKSCNYKRVKEGSNAQAGLGK
jgi:hypothetical protein